MLERREHPERIAAWGDHARMDNEPTPMRNSIDIAFD